MILGVKILILSVWLLFVSVCPSQHFFSHVKTGLPGLNSTTKQGLMCLALSNLPCSKTQHSDAGKA